MKEETLKYTKEHEWIYVEDNVGVIGITDHAQQQLGDITFVELPEIGKEVQQFSEIGVVESIKAASDIYSPISGTIIEVNENLNDNPQLLNTDPYGEGWICKIRINNLEELNNLLNYNQYQELLHSEA